MTERLKLEEREGAGDCLVASVDHNGNVCIECSEPWGGNTESGFGRVASVTLTRAQAAQLAQYLMAAMNPMSGA